MLVNKINGMLCNTLITDGEGNEDGRGKCSKKKKEFLVLKIS